MRAFVIAGHQLLAALLLTLLLCLSGCAHHRRDAWQKPTEVIAALGITRGGTVADLGAGDGYFTFYLADAVGPEGTVLAVEIDEDRLAKLAKRTKKQGLNNIQTVLASETSSGLHPQSVDLILVSNTYHHIADRVRYFESLRRALRPGARVAIIELNEVPWMYALFLGPHTTEPETIRQEMQLAGYRLVSSHGFLEYQSFQVFSATESMETDKHPEPKEK